MDQQAVTKTELALYLTLNEIASGPCGRLQTASREAAGEGSGEPQEDRQRGAPHRQTRQHYWPSKEPRRRLPPPQSDRSNTPDQTAQAPSVSGCRWTSRTTGRGCAEIMPTIGLTETSSGTDRPCAKGVSCGDRPSSFLHVRLTPGHLSLHACSELARPVQLGWTTGLMGCRWV